MTAPIRPELAVTPVPDNHLRAVLQAYAVTEAVAVVGIRGYVQQFKDSAAGKNLIGKYDDVLCLVTPTVCTTFLGNTDPSRTIAQRAILVVGQKVRYQRGTHGITGPKEKQRQAWVQSSGVTIQRYQADGTLGPVLKNQWIGANIHDGSWTTTGSAACQTVVPEKWKSFDKMVEDALRAAAQTQFWYILTQ